MKKRYYHVSGRITEEGVFCTECGAELDNDLMSDVPCPNCSFCVLVMKV